MKVLDFSKPPREALALKHNKIAGKYDVMFLFFLGGGIISNNRGDDPFPPNELTKL